MPRWIAGITSIDARGQRIGIEMMSGAP